MNYKPILAALFAFACATHLALADSNVHYEVLDRFGRRLNERGITLVDWDGYMANPAIQISIHSSTLTNAVLSANNPRIYFDRPHANGKIDLVSGAATIFISIFPDRDSESETHELRIAFGTNITRVPIHVIDLDRPHTNQFPIAVNYSQDKTGFFNDPQKRAVVQQVVEDWSYFIDDMQLDPVPARAERTFIWPPDRFANAHEITNAKAYSGYLLYAYGFHSAALRSGGEGSHSGALQRSHGVTLPIKRSGAFEAETAGNYNSLGWSLNMDDDDWAHTTNLRHETNDFYSIARHEIGHALFFNVAHPAFSQFRKDGHIDTPEIRAYLGHPARVDASDHLAGETDPASQRGAFGNDYGGNTPRGRWLTTKLDLLCAQALGYKLRPIAALAPLTIQPVTATAQINRPFQIALNASGGIPTYNFEILSNSLPPGLTLDPFTDKISGVPTSKSHFDSQIKIKDNAGTAVTNSITIRVID